MLATKNSNFLSILSIEISVFVFALGFFILSYINSSVAEQNEFGNRKKDNLNSKSKFLLNKRNNFYTLQCGFEIGFLDILSHKIQFDTNGTKFDYVDEGGQDVLFPFSRLTAELNLFNKHNVIFLIQPFDLQTEALLKRHIVVDALKFPAGTPIELRYGFTFYRISYLYDFIQAKKDELALGLSLQLRNATISFASTDGSLFRINENVGPVPILKFRGKYAFNSGVWIGSEIDGFYASGKYITGSDNDFEGAILDASARIGFELTDYLDTFLNIRYIGGGAKGTEEDDPGPGDGFTDNWLQTMSISLGFYLR
ncbi:hypothetical protein H8E77_10500 [bacterium]|nr:hypothetical protein [bacterium]